MTDASRVAERLAAWEASLKDFRLPDWESLPQLGLYMDQVILLLRQYLGPLSRSEEDKPITASIINNYVRLKVMPPPVKNTCERGPRRPAASFLSVKSIMSHSSSMLFSSGRLMYSRGKESRSPFAPATSA